MGFYKVARGRIAEGRRIDFTSTNSQSKYLILTAPTPSGTGLESTSFHLHLEPDHGNLFDLSFDKSYESEGVPAAAQITQI